MHEPSLATVLTSAIDSRLLEVHTMLPGRVASYDAQKETAVVEVMTKLPIGTGGGGVVYEEFPRIEDVQVLFPRGGSAFIKWKLKKGDGVMLLFSEQDPSAWRNSASANAPKDTTRHSLSHPIAYAGWPSKSDIGPTVGGDEIVIESEEIHLGHGASELIARADRVEAELDKIKTAFATHTHTGVTTGAGSTATPASPPYTPGDVGCDKVKGK